MFDDIRKMANDEFVKFCYKTILRRPPDEGGLVTHTNALNKNLSSREDILLMFITCDEFKKGK